jgi:hypothetical protein
MNLQPNIDPGTAYSDNGVVHWLTNDTCDARFIFSLSCVSAFSEQAHSFTELFEALPIRPHAIPVALAAELGLWTVC